MAVADQQDDCDGGCHETRSRAELIDVVHASAGCVSGAGRVRREGAGVDRFHGASDRQRGALDRCREVRSGRFLGYPNRPGDDANAEPVPQRRAAAKGRDSARRPACAQDRLHDYASFARDRMAANARRPDLHHFRSCSLAMASIGVGWACERLRRPSATESPWCTKSSRRCASTRVFAEAAIGMHAGGDVEMSRQRFEELYAVLRCRCAPASVAALLERLGCLEARSVERHRTATFIARARMALILSFVIPAKAWIQRLACYPAAPKLLDSRIRRNDEMLRLDLEQVPFRSNIIRWPAVRSDAYSMQSPGSASPAPTPAPAPTATWDKRRAVRAAAVAVG